MANTLISGHSNGNTYVMIYEDGTKVRLTMDDEFYPEFPESMDYKITNRCTGTNCAFCHERSGPDGAHGDIMNDRFIETLKPGTELALGGGNVLEHPDFVPFLHKLKTLGIIANATFNQKHFLENIDMIKGLADAGLLHGIGISLGSSQAHPQSLLAGLRRVPFPNAVIHVINGVHSLSALSQLYDQGLKLLILGYKTFGRGEGYYAGHSAAIDSAKSTLRDELPELIKHFDAVSFDNLAIVQLNVREVLGEEEWNGFYMGAEGEFTMYVDSVNKQYAISSTSVDRYPLEDDAKSMFSAIRKKAGFMTYEEYRKKGRE